MLDLKRIRTETDRVREAIAFKKTQADLDRYLLLDEQRRELLAEAERLKHERNAVSEEIGRLKRAGKDAPDKVAAMKRVGEEIKTLDARIAGLESELEKILVWIPNVPHPSVPRAGDAAGNVVVRESGTFRKLGFKPKQHWELAESLGLLDFDRAGKIAGAGFLLFTGRGARLERALIQFMIDSETRGMIRVHQFDKVELVKLVRPETSYDEHEKLLADAEAVLDALELPHRVVLLAAGDLSFAGAKCYDLETWAPGEDRWLEVSSCSNFEDFQARRAGIRFRSGPGAKAEYVHTLNASGLALPRTFATLLEYHQTERGTVRIPDALAPYLDGERELRPL